MNMCMLPVSVYASCTTDTLCSRLSSQSPPYLMSPLPVGDQLTNGTYTGVGIGVSVFILIVLVIMVGLILVVVVRRKTVLEQNEDMTMDENPYYNKTAVMEQEIEIREKSIIYEDPDNGKSKENGSVIDGFDPTENVSSKVWIKSTEKPAPKVSTTSSVSAANIEELYAVVDKSKKKGTKEERECGPAVADRDDLYSMPMKKKGMMTEEGQGAVESVGVEKGEEHDGMVGLKYEPMADSESGQQSEGDGKAHNVDMLYAVVDKSHKKKQ